MQVIGNTGKPHHMRPRNEDTGLLTELVYVPMLWAALCPPTPEIRMLES